MAEDLKIIIQQQLDDSEQQINLLNRQIQNISEKLNNVDLKINIDNAAFDNIESKIESIGRHVAKGLALDIDVGKIDGQLEKVSKKYKVAVGEARTLRQETYEYTDQLGRTVKIIDNIDKDTSKVVDTTETLTNNIKNLRNAIYKDAESTIKNIYNIETKLLQSGEQETAELQKQLTYQKEKLANLLREKNAKGLDDPDRNAKIYQQELQYIRELHTAQAKLADTKSAQMDKDHAAAIKTNQLLDQQTAKLEQQLELFKQRMLGSDGLKGELEIFSIKNPDFKNIAALEELEKSVKNLNIDTPNLNKQMKQLALQFSSLKQEAAQSSSFMARTIEGLGKFLRFYLVGGLAVKAVNQVKDIVNVVRELDTALVEINKVLDLSSQQMQKLSREATELGIQYGRTTVEVLNSVEAFAKSGLDQQTSQQFAELAMLLSNVGDISTETAQKTLIMANAGYQLGNDYKALNALISQFNELANRNAIDVQFLAEGWQNSANIAKQAKLSIEDYNAILTVAGSVTQKSGAEVGNALRTWLMRLQGVTDGTDTLEEDISKVDKVLDELGIQIRKSPTEFKPAMESIAEIAAKYRELGEAGNTVKQSEMLEAMAGKYRANVVAGILDNFEQIDKALQDQADSFMSAEKENARYLDSIEAKTGALRAQWELFASKTLDSSIIKFFVDLARMVVKLADNDFARLIGAITLLGVGFAGLQKALTIMQRGIRNTWLEIVALDIAEKGLAATTKALTTSMLASPLFWVAAGTTAIYLLVKAIDAVTVSVEEQREKVERLTEEYNALKDEIARLRNMDELTESQEAYLELLEREKVIQEELLRIEQERLMKKEVFGEGVWGKGIAGDIEREVQSLQNLEDTIANIHNLIKQYQDDGYDTSILFEQLDDAKERAVKLEQTLIEQKKTIQEYMDIFGEDEALVGLMDKIDGMLPRVQELNGTLGDTSGAKDQADALSDLSKETEALAEKQKELQEAFDASIKSYQDVTDKIKSLYKIQNELTKSDGDYAQVMDEVVAKHPELIQYLGNRIDLENAISQAIVNQEDIQRQAYTNMLENSTTYFNEQIKGNTQLWNAVSEAYGKDANNFNRVADAKAATDAKLRQWIGAGWANLYGSDIKALEAYIGRLQSLAGHYGAYAPQGLSQQISVATAQLNALRALNRTTQAAVSSISFKGVNLSGITTSKPKSGTGSKGKTGKSAAEKTSDAIRKFLESLENKTAITEFNLEMNQLDQSYYNALGNINKVNELRIKEMNLLKRLNSQLKSNKSSIEKKMKTVKRGSDDYNTLQDALFDVTQEMRKNEVAIIDINEALKEHDRMLRDRIIEAEQLVLKAVMANAKAQYDANKKRLQDEYETNKKIIQDKIDTLNKEKALIREEYNARRQQKQEEQKLEELRKLEERYGKISKDNSGMFEKEKLDLAKQIADLREEIYEDEVLKQIELREKSIDDQIDQHQKEQELLDSKYQANQEKLEDAYQKAQETHAEYWKEVEKIMSGSQTSIINYLKKNLDEYKQAGKLQREAYLEGWGDLFGDVKKIQSGQTKSSAVVKREVGGSTGTNYSSASSGSSSSSSSSSSKPKVSSIKPVLKSGSKGNDVKTLQRALNMILGTKLDTDGKFGPKTLNAVKQFQKKYKLAVDGSVGPKTKAKFKALGYSDGGKVDYTGLAMVHGSKQKPEAFLNAKQTSIFKTIADDITRPSSAMMGLLKGNSTNNDNSRIIFNPIIHVTAKDIDENSGRKIGRDIRIELEDMFDEARRKSGVTVPILGSQ